METLEPLGARLRARLFNPFLKIAGWLSLILGLAVIAATGLIASAASTRFAPSFYVREMFVDWLWLSGVLWCCGRMFSRTYFRNVDLLGTLALARWPLIIIPFVMLTPAYQQFRGIGVLAVVAVLPWVILLSYRAYTLVANLQGVKALWSFGVGLLVAELLSKPMLLVTVLLAVPPNLPPDDDTARPRLAPLPEAATNQIAFEHVQTYSFDTEEGIEKKVADAGLTRAVENGEFRIRGTTTDDSWAGDAVQVSLPGDAADLEVSGRFRLAQRERSGLVFLGIATEKAGPLILIYEWVDMGKRRWQTYWIQTRWLGMTNTLASGIRRHKAFGNEEADFQTLRIYVRKDHRNADFFANDDFIDTVAFSGEVGRLTSAGLEFQTPQRGAAYDIRFDDLTLKWNNPKE